MSAEEVASRLRKKVQEREYDVAHPESIPYLFDGFDTKMLLKADDLAHNKVIAICARVAVDAANYRQKKFEQRDAKRIVVYADFIPAFRYISYLSIRDYLVGRLSILDYGIFPSLEDVGVFTSEVSELIRDCCPWC